MGSPVQAWKSAPEISRVCAIQRKPFFITLRRPYAGRRKNKEKTTFFYSTQSSPSFPFIEYLLNILQASASF
jgi:hypothetical protein